MWYYSLNEYLKHEFGEKLYKIALQGTNTCPNRDGTLGNRGCIFCSESGSGEFAQPFGESLDRQFSLAKERISEKTKARRFIAYFSFIL